MGVHVDLMAHWAVPFKDTSYTWRKNEQPVDVYTSGNNTFLKIPGNIARYLAQTNSTHWMYAKSMQKESLQNWLILYEGAK